MSACLVAACRSLRATGRVDVVSLALHAMVLFVPHRGTVSLYPTGTPSLRRSERTPYHARFARRIALAGASSSLFGVGASSCGVSASSSSGSGLGVSCAGVMVRGGSPGPSSSYGALSERAAVRVAGRMVRSAAVFWGAGACGCFFAETRSVCSRVLSAVWSGPVRMRGQRFCVLTDTDPANTGFSRDLSIGG